MWMEVNNISKIYRILILFEILTHTQPLPIILIKSTMVQSTGTNNIGRDWYTIPLNFNNRPVRE